MQALFNGQGRVMFQSVGLKVSGPQSQAQGKHKDHTRKAQHKHNFAGLSSGHKILYGCWSRVGLSHHILRLRSGLDKNRQLNPYSTLEIAINSTQFLGGHIFFHNRAQTKQVLVQSMLTYYTLVYRTGQLTLANSQRVYKSHRRDNLGKDSAHRSKLILVC